MASMKAHPSTQDKPKPLPARGPFLVHFHDRFPPPPGVPGVQSREAHPKDARDQVLDARDVQGSSAHEPWLDSR